MTIDLKKCVKSISLILKVQIRSILPKLIVLILISTNPYAATINPSADSFPATLPAPPEMASASNVNTPEYVIIRPSDQVTFSSESNGTISVLTLKEGSSFKTGDILLEMDCRLPQAELKKARAQQRSTSMAQLSATKLKSYGAISEFELVKATSEAQMANADVDKLSAIVDKCVFKAPFNGSVAELMVHPYESVKPGDPLMKIVNTDNLELEIQVPSNWLQWLHVGSVFQVRLNETHKTVSATVTKINPLIEPVSQSVKIIGTIMKQDSDVLLLPGMSGQAVFDENPSQPGATHHEP